MKNSKTLLKLLSPYKKHLFLILLSVIIANAAGLFLPWALKLIVDEVVIKKEFAALNMICLALILAFLARFCFGYLREYLSSFVGEKVVCDLREKIYWQLQRLSVHYVDSTPKGRIISGITSDVEDIRDFLFGGAMDFIYGIFNIVFVFTVLAALDRELALISFLYLPVFILVFHHVAPQLKERHGRIREHFSALTSTVNEFLQGIRVVAGFSSHEAEAKKFCSRQRELFGASIESHRMSILLWVGAEFLSSLALATVVWFGARRVMSGSITVGTLIAFYSYLAMLFYPLVRMAIINDYYQQASAGIERVRQILEARPRVVEPKNPVRLSAIDKGIVFSGVSFGYNEAKEALSDINLKIDKSQVVAIVGKSGAGKTTLINLLLRFYDPQKGEILIDGHDLKHLDLGCYRRRIAMVIQDDYLFAATVRENISYGRPDATQEQVVEAARKANAHDFIMQLESGYSTGIGERGVRLSYGQRQRISIARAILRDPEILILDEATSNVDTETEKAIIEQAFRNLIKDRTTLIVAHRMSAISYANRVVFLDGGRITEAGSPSELISKKGDYWRMLSGQQEAAAI